MAGGSLGLGLRGNVRSPRAVQSRRRAQWVASFPLSTARSGRGQLSTSIRRSGRRYGGCLVHSPAWSARIRASQCSSPPASALALHPFRLRVALQGRLATNSLWPHPPLARLPPLSSWPSHPGARVLPRLHVPTLCVRRRRLSCRPAAEVLLILQQACTGGRMRAPQPMAVRHGGLRRAFAVSVTNLL